MHPSRTGSLGIELLLLAALGGALYPAPAHGHKVVVFATGAESSIQGEVYFHGGTAARNVKVTLLGPGDQVVGISTTDEEGKFSFPVHFRCDYKVVADAGGGHGGQYTVAADELADDLPAPASPRDVFGRPSPAAEPAASHASIAVRPSGDQPLAARRLTDLETEIEALGKQIAALRGDLNKYQNRLRLQDILGGLGYILGIMGITFYFLGVRGKEKAPTTGDRRLSS